MQAFHDIPHWRENNITALQHPMAEFNTREGVDLGVYQAVDQHLAEAHPTQGAENWAVTQANLPAVEQFEDRKTGQHLRVQRFNWTEVTDTGAETVTVFNDAFSVPVDMKHVTYQHKLLADALGSPLIVFENPGFGESDKLTQAQKTALRKNGDFKPIAEPMLGIL